MNAASNRKPEVLLDKETYFLVRGILVQGPINRPRAILESYSTFLYHWHIARQRGLNLDAKLLTGIILLKNEWRDEFEATVNYPEYFFYLHALSTGKANSVCTPSEVDELLDLGLPNLAESSLLQGYRDVNLIRLLAEIELPHAFDINDLWQYPILESKKQKEELAPIGIHQEHIREALLSGDPVRIRFIKRVDTSGKVRQVYKIHILGDLGGFLNRLQADEQISDTDIKDIEALVYAAGLIGDEDAVQILQKLLTLGSKLPYHLQLRTIYALGHLGFRDVPEAVNWLVNIVRADEDRV